MVPPRRRLIEKVKIANNERNCSDKGNFWRAIIQLIWVILISTSAGCFLVSALGAFPRRTRIFISKQLVYSKMQSQTVCLRTNVSNVFVFLSGLPCVPVADGSCFEWNVQRNVQYPLAVFLIICLSDVLTWDYQTKKCFSISIFLKL